MFYIFNFFIKRVYFEFVTLIKLFNKYANIN